MSRPGDIDEPGRDEGVADMPTPAAGTPRPAAPPPAPRVPEFEQPPETADDGVYRPPGDRPGDAPPEQFLVSNRRQAAPEPPRSWWRRMFGG